MWNEASSDIVNVVGSQHSRVNRRVYSGGGSGARACVYAVQYEQNAGPAHRSEALPSTRTHSNERTKLRTAETVGGRGLAEGDIQGGV